MITFHYFTKENVKDLNQNWPQITDHPYRTLIIGGSRSGKKNRYLFNLISKQPIVIKFIYMWRDLYEAKYKLLINKRESTGLKHFDDSKDFVKYSKYMYDIYRNVGKYNTNKKRKILIVFDDMITDLLSNEIVIRRNPSLERRAAWTGFSKKSVSPRLTKH